MSGWVILTSLSLLALLASGTAAARANYDSRGERVLVVLLVSTTLVILPIHALAWFGFLSAFSLGVTSFILSVAVLILTTLGDRSRWLKQGVAVCFDLVRLPFEALTLAWNTRNLIGLGLLATFCVILWTIWLSYLAPTTVWDALWYHEPIVGFALQENGAGLAPVESVHQYVNGYPKIAEYFTLWFVVFTDRRLIEIAPSLMGIVILIGTYTLIRRSAIDRLNSIGWAVALLFLPAIVLQFRSTLTDVTVVAMVVFSMCFITRPILRDRDLFLGAIAIGLLGGTKATALFLGGIYLLILASRYILQNRSHVRFRIIFSCVAAITLSTVIASPPYVRNWIEHQNPIWPMALKIPSIGVEFEGKNWAVPKPTPADRFVQDIFSPPEPGKEFADTRTNGYGNGMPYAIFPLSILGIFVLAGTTIAGIWQRRRLDFSTRILWCLIIPSTLCVLATPSIGWARFHLHAVVVAVVIVAWLLRDKRWDTVSYGIICATIFSELVTLSWSSPGWEVDWKTAIALAKMPVKERAIQTLGAGTRIPETIARARENELHAGDVVTYEGKYLFIGNLWNETFSNQVKYLECKNAKLYEDQLGDANVSWAVVSKPECVKRLRTSVDSWEFVGELDRKTVVFRRKEASKK
jgi:hypothetical protein